MKQYDAFKAFFKKINSQYAALKKRCEPRVVANRWATEDMFDIRPLSQELSFRPGKWMTRAPREPFYKNHFSLDADGRPVVETMELNEIVGRRWRETFYVPEDEGMLIACFEHRQEKAGSKVKVTLEVLERLLTVKDRATQYERLNRINSDQYLRFEYEYQKGRISSVKTAEYFVDKMNYATWAVEYGTDAEVHAIASKDGGKCDSIRWPYRKGSKSLTFPQVRKQFEAKLLELIIHNVKQAKIKHPVFSLVLGYSSESETALRPYVGIGTERERSAWLVRLKPAELKAVLWNPEEYEHSAAKHKVWLLDDPDHHELSESYIRLHGDFRLFESSLKSLQSVAKQLMQHNWSGALKPTDDFVVTTYDLDDPAAIAVNMKASVPAAQVKSLSKLGWV